MIAVIQRIAKGSVLIDSRLTANAEKGLLVLLGIAENDTEHDGDLLADKIAKLRIFEDENGKMNRSVTDVAGSVIVVSNFTLLANYRRGNRPDFMGAAKPEAANALYEAFKKRLRPQVPALSSGEFGADMQVSLVNDGPVTIVMDSEKLKEGRV